MSLNNNDEKPPVVTPYGASITQGSSSSDLEQLKQLEVEAEGRLAELGSLLQGIKSKIHNVWPPIYPMYAATLTQVTAGGDLAEMKRLEAAAEQQLANHDNIAKALQDLKAEIARLS
jgi:hypothetical protein